MAIRKIVSRSITDGAVVANDLSSNSVTNAKIAAGAISGDKLDTNIQFAFKNRIINGAMIISQRGSSFAPAGGYTLDRWSYNAVTSGAATVTQNADVPSTVSDFTASLRFAVTTADTSIASTDIAYIRQKVEGFNARGLVNNTFTLSFWARSTKTGVHCVSFASSTGDRSYVTEYTISVANTWEFKTITVSGGLNNASGTWDWTNGTGVDVRWALASGSNYNTTAGAWQSSNYFATSGQVNVLDSTSNIFAITGVQLEVGASATPFDTRAYGTELALCQRYFERSDGNTQVVGSATGFGGNTYGSFTTFSVQKRAAPTISVADMAGTAGRITWWQGATQFNNQNFGPETVNTKGFSADTQVGRTDAGLGRFTWTASSEL